MKASRQAAPIIGDTEADLSDLAIADDVDTRLDLLSHDVDHRTPNFRH